MDLIIVKFHKHWLFLWTTDVKHLSSANTDGLQPSVGLLGPDNHSMF